MDDAVAALDVRLDDADAVDRGVLLADINALPVEGGERGAAQHLTRVEFARDDMVSKDADEHVPVLGLEQRLNGALGQLGERLIGRSEHGEGALALECTDEVRFGQRCGEGLEAARGDGRVDDVLLGGVADTRHFSCGVGLLGRGVFTRAARAGACECGAQCGREHGARGEGDCFGVHRSVLLGLEFVVWVESGSPGLQPVDVHRGAVRTPRRVGLVFGGSCEPDATRAKNLHFLQAR